MEKLLLLVAINLLILITFHDASFISIDPPQSNRIDIEDDPLDFNEDVHFYLFTPDKPNTPHRIDLKDTNSLAAAGYNGSLPVKILCHGFTQNYLSEHSPFVVLKPAYDKCGGEVNLIAVDWSKNSGSVTTDKINKSYLPAAIYTEQVGRATAVFINYLAAHGGTPSSSVHLIGFSLGAHSMGFAGLFYQQEFGGMVDRVTGLDAAGPCFDETTLEANFFCHNILVRHLQKMDARIVDVVHTAANFYGFTYPIGTIDFNMNGGYLQPHCGSAAEDFKSRCSHRLVLPMYAESICNAKAFKSAARVCSKSSRDEKVSKNCQSTQSIYMGEHLTSNSTGVFLVPTTDRSHYNGTKMYTEV